MFMPEEKLDELIKQAIIDRLEGWELIEFLGISIEDVVLAFEDTILENLNDVCDFIDIRINNNDEE